MKPVDVTNEMTLAQAAKAIDKLPTVLRKHIGIEQNLVMPPAIAIALANKLESIDRIQARYADIEVAYRADVALTRARWDRQVRHEALELQFYKVFLCLSVVGPISDFAIGVVRGLLQ